MRPNPNAFSEKLTNTQRHSSTRESKSIHLWLNQFRRYLILEDQYKQKQNEYNDNNAKIKEMIPSKEEDH